MVCKAFQEITGFYHCMLYVGKECFAGQCEVNYLPQLLIY
jgi:hypothetical protein